MFSVFFIGSVQFADFYLILTLLNWYTKRKLLTIILKKKINNASIKPTESNLNENIRCPIESPEYPDLVQAFLIPFYTDFCFYRPGRSFCFFYLLWFVYRFCRWMDCQKIQYGDRNRFNLGSGNISSKTRLGSLTFFLVSFLILFLGIPFFYSFSGTERIIFAFTISLIATIAEAASSNGFDNITVPLVILIMMIFEMKILYWPLTFFAIFGEIKMIWF